MRGTSFQRKWLKAVVKLSRERVKRVRERERERERGVVRVVRLALGSRGHRQPPAFCSSNQKRSCATEIRAKNSLTRRGATCLVLLSSTSRLKTAENFMYARRHDFRALLLRGFARLALPLPLFPPIRSSFDPLIIRPSCPRNIPIAIDSEGTELSRFASASSLQRG